MKKIDEVKIIWSKVFKHDHIKNIIKDYACGQISFDDMKDFIKTASPILSSEVSKMDILGNDAVHKRVCVALNASGTPISGFRHCVYFLP